MNDPVHRAATQELIMRLIDQDPHCQLVDRGHLDRLRARNLDAAEATGSGRCGHRGGRFQKVAAL
jgi:hypothetical protein